MSGPSRLSLFGFVNPREKLPGFLVPIFGTASDLWIQDGKGNGFIDRFSPCTVPTEKVVAVPDASISAKLGDALIYAFQFADGKIEVGTKDIIQGLLIERLEEFRNLPFLRIDILKFINRLNGLADAIQAAREKLALTDPAIAEEWAVLMQSTDEASLGGEDRSALANQQIGGVPTTAPLFQTGDLVALRSNPAVVIPIIEVIPGPGEFRYRVFQNNTKVTYYESQLQLPPTAPLEPKTVTAQDLQAHLTSVQILSPSTATLFSLRSGRVQFVPYQYRPVLKLIRSDRPRLLIADEVGVGKTIEAGLIMKELRARTDLSSVLIICPKALVAE